ncbi:MAG TPA: hypothetical protein VM639_01215 [Dongiaceae bacterium]|nr:hypothetical protein [Dongiaceae bacterium]
MHKPAELAPDIFDRTFWRFAASLQQKQRTATKVLALAVAIVIVFAGMMAASPRILLSDYTYDFFIPLDGALRSLNGQWPHLDFYTPVGDLYYVSLGLAARIFGFTPKLVLWEQLIFLPFALWATILATRDRLPASLRAILILMVGLLCISPSDLDDSSSLSFLASYNRHGWVLMTPLVAACLLEPLQHRKGRWITDAILLFLLALALFYLKMTFALVAIVTILLGIVLVPANRRSCFVAGVLLAATLSVIWWSGPLMAAYFSDLHRTSLASPISAQSYDPFRLVNLKTTLSSEWFALLAPLCFAVWLGRSSQTLEERRSGNRTLLVCMIATGGSLGLAWQNHEHAIPSQVVAMAIVFAAIWKRQMRREQAATRPLLGSTDRPAVILAGLVLTFIAGCTVLNSGRGIVLHTVKTAFNLGQPASTLSPILQGLTVPIDPTPGIIGDVLAGKIDPALYSVKSLTSWHNDIAGVLDDGYKLFEANKPNTPRIVTLYSAPLMTVATKTMPPRHMAAWMDYERTFGPRSPIMPEKDFSDANVVMVLKIYDHEKLFSMVSDYLHANFHIAGETPVWQMWVRNGS